MDTQSGTPQQEPQQPVPPAKDSDIDRYERLQRAADEQITRIGNAYDTHSNLIQKVMTFSSVAVGIIVAVAGILFTVAGILFFKNINDMETKATQRVQDAVVAMTNSVETKLTNEEFRVDSLIEATLKKDNVDKLVNDKVQEKVSTITDTRINNTIHSDIDPSITRITNDIDAIEKNLSEATTTSAQVKEGMTVALNIVGALNDDRKAFEALLDARDSGTNAYESTINAAISAVTSQETMEDISIGLLKFANLTETNSWDDYMKAFNSMPGLPPYWPSGVLQQLSLQTNLPHYNKLVLYEELLKHSPSLEILSRTCKILSKETPYSMNVMGYPTYLQYITQELAPMIVTNITETLRTNKNDVMLYLHRADAYETVTNYPLAEKDCKKALSLQSTNAEAQNCYAWFLATCPDARFRDGQKAVELATKACESNKWKEWRYVGTLAAAYAESKDFTNAIKYVKIALASDGIQDYEARAELRRLRLYEQHKPARE